MELGQIQAYAYFFFTAFLVTVLYAYIVHLYRAEKRVLEIMKNMEI